MSVFLETSFFIRFFTRDDEKKYVACAQVLQKIQEGKISPYTSNVVLIEVYFVLSRLYKYPKQKITDTLNAILNMRNMTFIEKTSILDGMRLFEASNMKLNDCLIATQVPEKATLVTYDEDFGKIASLRVSTPEKIV